MAFALTFGSCYVFSASGGCGAGERGKEAVKSMGFRDIQMGNPSWLHCGQFGSHFVARDARGKHVEGHVCCSVFEGRCEVR